MDPIHAFLTNDTLPIDRTEAKAVRRRSARYLLLQGILYRRSYSLPLLRCVSPQQGDYILHEIHEGACGDHSGSRSLAFKAVRQGYYWPSLHADATWLVQRCDPCHRFGSVSKVPAEPLSPIPSPWSFAQWGLDLIGPMPPGKGQVKFAVVAVDYFTKWAEAEALTTITAAKIEHFVEAINKIIKKTLKKKLGAAFWPEILPEALWAINTSYRRSTGETPFSLAFGTEAVVPVEVHAPTCRTATYDPQQNEHQLALNLDLIDEHRSQAQLRNATYKQRTARYYDSRVKHRSFKVGDWVLRKVSLATRNPTEGTLGPYWEGPFQIVSLYRLGTYRLRGSDGQTLGHPWNVEHLKFYYK
ncbi:unnamed protein product [Prunus brigantina]